MTLPFHPLADCFPLIEGREYQDLVDDIRKHGLRESIVVHEGQILDGRNRYRACLDADMPYHVKPFGAGDPVAFVISINLRRRHMDESQRAVVAARLENLGHGQRADLVGRDANLHLLPEPTKLAPVTRQQAAELLNVSPRSVAAARTVIDHAIPDLTQKVERGEVSVSAAADVARLPEPAQQEIIAKGAAEILKAASRIRTERSEARKAERAQQIAIAAAGIPSASERYTLLHGSLTNLLDHPAESVDFVITDPPYPEEYLPLFGDLGAVAQHLLKPGGLLLCMSGQTYLPEIFAMLGQHLDYYWMTSYSTGGQSPKLWHREVTTFWKPVLVYSKGAYTGDCLVDVVKSDANDKSHHHWGQSVSGMRDLMRRFVWPGHVVVDPFLGGGTTAVVALELGAFFIGCDVDEQAIDATKARLADAPGCLRAG